MALIGSIVLFVAGEKQIAYERSELALALERTERSLDRWAEIGEGPPRVKLGSRVLYPKAMVLKWLSELKLPPAPKRRKRA